MSEINPEQTDVNTEADSDGSVNDGPEPDVNDVEFFNQHEGQAGRLPGQYLDEIERKQAEILRAESEDREPDLENPPATTGTPLVTADQLPDNSISARQVYTEDDGEPVPANNTPEPTTVLPVDQYVPDAGPTFGGQVPSEQDIANAQLGNQPGDPVTGGTPSNQTLTGVQHAELTKQGDNADAVSSDDSVGDNSATTASASGTEAVTTETPESNPAQQGAVSTGTDVPSI